MAQQQTRYGLASCALFGVAAALFVVTSVILDSALSALPLAAQRWLGFLTLVLPAAIGVALALVALTRPHDHRIAAVAGLVLNALFAAFFTLVLLLGG
jgi:uncharacterized membrane protein